MIVNNAGLTEEQMRSAVPSVFAESPHESRSKRYGYVPTGDMLAGLREEGLVPTSVMQARSKDKSRETHTKHLVRLRKYEDLGSQSLDVHEIVLINSHDGSSSYQLMSGVFRLICENGTIIGTMDDTLRVQHKSNALADVIEGTYRIVEGSAQVMEEIEEMKGIELSREEQLLLSEYAMAARFNMDEEDEDKDKDEEGETRALVPYRPEDFLRVHRYADKASDLYTVYNILQENHIRGGVSRRDHEGNKHTTRAVKGIDQTVRINRLLWQFTKAMKELKS